MEWVQFFGIVSFLGVMLWWQFFLFNKRLSDFINANNRANDKLEKNFQTQQDKLEKNFQIQHDKLEKKPSNTTR